MAKPKTKIQVLNCVLALTTAAGKRAFKLTTETDYKKVRGFYIKRNTGTSYLRVGIFDASGTAVVEPTSINHLVVQENVKISDRFYIDSPFDGGGKNLQVTVENFAVIGGAAEDFDVLFLLDNED